MMVPIALALAANVAFSSASYFFAHYSRLISPLWMNFFKANVAAILFVGTCVVMGLGFDLSAMGILLLVLSGLLGLAIGDVFLLKAFAELGPGRALMIFGFQPLFLGVFAQAFMNQEFPLKKVVAILFLIGCVFSFAFENLKKSGNWGWVGIQAAFIGMFLDATGILLTRTAFDMNPELSPFVANMIRALAAASFFWAWAVARPKDFEPVKTFLRQTNKNKWIIVIASVFGTYLSLSLYLTAVKMGHLATVSAVVGTSPLVASLFEVVMGRKTPTRWFFIGISNFIIGFLILMSW